jgi:hypothetical protein
MRYKIFKRAFLYGLCAAVIYSLIAFFANSGHSFDLRLKVSLGHGLFCMTMTIFSTSLMEYFFNKFSKIESKYFGAIFVTGGISLTLMTTVHLILGTPELFRTILFSALTSLPYYLLFPLKLIFEWEQQNSKYSYRNQQNWAYEWPLKKFSTPYYLKDFFTVVKNNVWRVSSENEGVLALLPQKTILGKIDPKIKIVFLGDLMPTYNKKWTPSLEIKKIIQESDYLVCNFEGSIEAGPRVVLDQIHNPSILESLKTLKAPDKIILSVANNHAADFGYQKFLKSILLLEAEGFKVIGKRDQASIVLNGAVNLVAATEWSNQHHGYLSFMEHAENHLDKKKFNILYPHWGHELELFPRPSQIQVAQNLVKNWDAVIGHHTHVPGVITLLDSKLVAFSLGDSSTGLPRRRYKCGQIISVEIGLDTNNLWKIGNIEWHFTKLINTKNENQLTVFSRDVIRSHSDLM